MNIKELTPELLGLTPAEKARIITLLSQSLANSWQGIEKTPGVCGGRACIKNTRIPVWVLVNARNLGISEIELLDNYPTLSAEDLTNAWRYYQVFTNEIDNDIQENEEEEY